MYFALATECLMGCGRWRWSTYLYFPRTLNSCYTWTTSFFLFAIFNYQFQSFLCASRQQWMQARSNQEKIPSWIFYGHFTFTLNVKIHSLVDWWHHAVRPCQKNEHELLREKYHEPQETEKRMIDHHSYMPYKIWMVYGLVRTDGIVRLGESHLRSTN